MDKFPNARIRELCRVTEAVDEGMYEGVLRWFGHVERMESDWAAKRVYVGDYAGICSVGRARKRWIDTVKECLGKEVWMSGKAKGIVHDRSVWLRFVKDNARGVTQGINP